MQNLAPDRFGATSSWPARPSCTSAVQVHVLTEQEIMVERGRSHRDAVTQDEVPDELFGIQVVAEPCVDQTQSLFEKVKTAPIDASSRRGSSAEATSGLIMRGAVST